MCAGSMQALQRYRSVTGFSRNLRSVASADDAIDLKFANVMEATDNDTAVTELVRDFFRHVDQLIIHPDSGSKPREVRAGPLRSK